MSWFQRLRPWQEWSQEELQTAIDEYTTDIQSNPTNSDLRNRRGEAYSWQRKFNEAIADYTEAIRLQPRAGYFSNRAHAYIGKGVCVQALADYTQAIRLEPTHQLYFSRGKTCLQLRMNEDALADFEKAIDFGYFLNLFQPGINAMYYHKKGLALHLLKHYQAAVDALNKSLSYDSENYSDVPFVYRLRGTANHGLGLLEQALEDVTRALAIRDEAVFYADRCGIFVAMQQFHKALEDACTFVGKSPSSLSYSTRGNIYFMHLKQYDYACADYKRAYECSPESANYASKYAAVLSDCGHLEESLIYYGIAENLGPSQSELLFIYTQRAITLNQLDRFEDALTDIERVISLSPDAGGMRADKATIYLELGRFDEAIEVWEALLKECPNNAAFYIGLTHCFTSTERFDDLASMFVNSVGRVLVSDTYNHNPRFEKLRYDDKGLNHPEDYLPPIIPLVQFRSSELFRRGRVDEALADINYLLQHGMRHPVLLVQRCNMLVNTKQLEAAAADIIELGTMLSISPDPACAVGYDVSKVRYLIQMEKRSEALGICTKRILESPKEEGTLYHPYFSFLRSILLLNISHPAVTPDCSDSDMKMALQDIIAALSFLEPSSPAGRYAMCSLTCEELRDLVLCTSYAITVRSSVDAAVAVNDASSSHNEGDIEAKHGLTPDESTSLNGRYVSTFSLIEDGMAGMIYTIGYWRYRSIDTLHAMFMTCARGSLGQESVEWIGSVCSIAAGMNEKSRNKCVDLVIEPTEITTES